jgi:hypothetical protein
MNCFRLERGRWSREVARSGMFTAPSGNRSWLGKLLKLDRAKNSIFVILADFTDIGSFAQNFDHFVQKLYWCFP